MSTSTEFTRRQRYRIAGRARTVHERLSGPPNEVADDDGSAETTSVDPDALVDDWAAALPDGVTLSERLAREDTDVEAIREAAARTRWPSDRPLPSWVDTLSNVVAGVTGDVPDGDTTAWIRSVVADDHPFVDLLAPVAAVAVRESPVGDAFDRTVSEPLVEWLLDRLQQLCTRALYVEFRSFLTHHDETLAETEPDDCPDPGREYYDRFCAAMLEDGFRDLFVEYPVLGRFLGTVVEQFRAAVSEFHERLVADREELRRQFDVSGSVTAIRSLTDDTHAGGRSPIEVVFETGRVVYKPRPTTGLTTLSRIVDRLLEVTDLPRVAVPETIRRDDYGWVEHVAPSEASDEAALDRYYRRAGVLLCLCRVLDLDDVHFENVIATGDDPVVVDAETLLSPAVAPENVPFADDTVGAVDATVAATGLVPAADRDPRRDAVGPLAFVAGLGDGETVTEEHGLTTTEVTAPNTDVMRARERPVEIDKTPNTPTLDGEPRPPAAHREALGEGYDRANRAIRRLHEAGEFRRTVVEPAVDWEFQTRLIYRSTPVYASLLESAVGIEPLRSGLRLSIVFEELERPFLSGDVADETFRASCAAERRALRRFDVPRLTAPADGTELHHDGAPTGVTADRSGQAALEDRLAALGSRDAERQRTVIDRCYTATDEATRSTAVPTPVDGDHEFVATAERAFTRLAAACLPADCRRREVWTERDGAAAVTPGVARGDALWPVDETWHWTTLRPVDPGVDLSTADDSVYDGRGGVALAAAGLYRVTGAERYAWAARSALAPLVEWVDSDPDRPSLGGTRGVGGVVYALSTVGTLLNDDSYHDHATRAASLVAPEHVRDDDRLDVMDGAAGTALATLRHYRRSGDEAALAAARHCGDHLVASTTAAGDGVAWSVADFDHPPTGFAHGASGIALALARLGAVTGDDRYERTARDAVAFEDGTWVADECNWREAVGGSVGADRWCWGRSGIALARLGVHDALGSVSPSGRLADALDAVAARGTAHTDHLCCGTLGRVETLLAGADAGVGAVDRPAAADLAARVIAQRREAGAFRLPGHGETYPNPTLYNGLAGVAYTLCRVARPTELPCLLAFE